MKRPSRVARYLLALDGEARRRFEAFTREHEQNLFALAYKYCGSRDAAQDLVQDTLEYALRSFGRLKPAGVHSWLGLALRHRFIDAHRHALTTSIEGEFERNADDWAAPELEEEPVWARITLAHLYSAVEKLPNELRDVYRLKTLEGLSYQEISQRLDLPTPTVGTRLLRARQRLKEILIHDMRPNPKSSWAARNFTRIPMDN
jgi:RNA polymerase sigma-70 factor (ECF subfamily)